MTGTETYEEQVHRELRLTRAELAYERLVATMRANHYDGAEVAASLDFLVNHYVPHLVGES